MNLIPKRFYLEDFFDDFVPQHYNDMKCDIFEENNAYNLILDIPGFRKEDINVEVNNGYVTITAERETNEEEKDKKFIRRERTYGKYQRSFNFGDIAEDKIDAEFKDGTLKIVLPKKEKIETKKAITIK
ncbi:MAG TPA: Hsp20/alpha crystallin family protein [Bacilli bacterium]|nr:Hsp20/alpha crystallin family protein [Bacilli bacterium]